MKEQEQIPTSKVQRAMRFARTGAKVGGNYVKHYSKKLLDPSLDRENLHQENARDIYHSLSELKGSALKAAQMISMQHDLLPAAYRSQFSQAQYSAPPLSYPLVVKTFRECLGREPGALFDAFTKSAVNAASIGQVHRAEWQGHVLAIKIQYPGVANSIVSDLRMLRPLAARILNVNGRELDSFMEEIAQKMLEETDYELELCRSQEISSACAHLEGVFFPRYYPEFSGKRIITMEWLEGLHLADFLKTNPSQDIRDLVGQRLWDFYHFQIHELFKLHADPHPGNFLFRTDGTLGILDFGCVKEIPESFYRNYFGMVRRDLLAEGNEAERDILFRNMGFIYDRDSPSERRMFTELFCEMIELLARPFHSDVFDFKDEAYFKQIYEMSERVQADRNVRSNKTVRGKKDAIYIDRTYFGIYHILHDLGARIHITRPDWLK